LARYIRKKLDVYVFSFGHLALMLSLHYRVKCRSLSLAIDNNEFLLGRPSSCVGSEIINWIATNTIGYDYLSKSHMYVLGPTLRHLHYSMWSKCPPAAQTQAIDVDTICQQHVQ